MVLLIPTKAEAVELLNGATRFRDWSLSEAALPPSFLVRNALAADDEGWTMPRLYGDEVSGAVVGNGGFKHVPRDRRVEIGYGIAPSHRNRGFATQGVLLLIAAAQASGLVDEVLAEVKPENLASRKVLERAGFSFGGMGTDKDGPVERWTKRIVAAR